MPPKRKSVQLVLTEPAPKNKGGRPQDPVWVHFIQTPLATADHFAAKCKYCKKKQTRGRPQDLQLHLARDCLEVQDDIRRIFIRNILLLYGDTEDENDNLQPTITDFWSKEHNEALSKPKQGSLDQSLLKMFVCCGVPFVVVEHPFFVEMFKKTCPGYVLPSRDKLSGIMLSHMTVRIENKIDAIFENATNLTLGNFF